MFTSLQPIILASGSPRRRNMLASMGISFTIMIPAVDETYLPAESPADYVTRIARIKGQAIAGLHPDHCIISADTAVICDDSILGKPVDTDDCLRMLTMLAGGSHQVLTSLRLCCRSQQLDTQVIRSTQVCFHSFDEPVLRAYANTGEGLDKAGGYAVQGKGAFLVASITGSSTNVIGLPLNELMILLLQHRFIAPIS